MLQTTAAAQINASVLTAGDYTVYVTGLPRNVTNAELIEYASHYGEVNQAAPPRAMQPTRYIKLTFCACVMSTTATVRS